MNTMAAFAMGEANRGKKRMVFDWDKAAEIIRDKKPKWAVAGLQHDMEWTSGMIYEDGQPVTDEYTYLSSTWATPILEIKIGDEVEEILCFRMQHEAPEWGSGTKWPHSAMEILAKGKEANEAVR
jgi:hypothetical protein